MDLTPVPLGSDIQVNTATSNERLAPSVTALGDGSFVVVWEKSSSNVGLGAFGQRFAADGSPIGTEFQVGPAFNGAGQLPTVTALADGGFVVTWGSWGHLGDQYMGTFGQRFAADGSTVGGEFHVNTYTLGEEQFPSVAALHDGGFVVTWLSYGYAIGNPGPDGSGTGVFAQRFGADGAPVGGQYQVNSTTAGEQTLPSITTLTSGDQVITWSSQQDGSGTGIYGQRYAADGTPQGGEFHVSTATAGDQVLSTTTALRDGGFLVTWQSAGQDGSGSGIYGQRFAADGTAIGGEFRANTFTSGDQTAASATALSDGGFLVTWSSLGQDGSGYGVYGQRYDADGVMQGSEFRINETTIGNQLADGSSGGEALATLSDGRVVQVWAGLGTEEVFFRTIDAPDPVNPSVTGITTVDPPLTSSGTVHYLVTFSEPVSGVDAGDFALHASGVTGASITGVAAVPWSNGTQYEVTVDTGSGDGTLSLSLTGAGITDLAGNPLGLLQPQTAVTAGANPLGAEVGDVNGDGNLDIAVTNVSSATVSILLGKGDGTFAPQVSFAVESSPSDVAIGDLNGDGKADLVTSNATSNSVSVLIGNGDGTFQPQAVHGTGAQTQSVALADFNGDGALDIVAANEQGSSVSVLLGNGDGTFQTQAAYGVGFNPFEAEAADLNGDGALDLAVANYWDNSVSVLLGNGDGTFQPQSVFGAAAGPQSVALADFNGDGTADLVAANHDSDSVSVLIGNGDGTFQPQVAYAAGDGPREVLTADVNGDGKLDIAVNDFYSDALTVLLGNGDGTFQAASSYATGDGAYGLAIGDLDGDGRADFVTANVSTNTVSLLLNGTETLAGPAYTIDKTPPVITSGASATVEENFPAAKAVYTVTVAAPDTAAGLTWSLTGDDAALCALHAPGPVPFNASPDYEAPADAGGNNVYKFTVHANDGANDTTQDVTVSVTDVFDPPHLGPEFIVNTTAEDNQWWTSVAGLSDGGYVITWMSPDSSASGLKGRVFDAAGHPAGNEFAINAIEEGEQIHPIVTGLSGGGFVATWMSDIGDGQQYCVRARVFDSSGNAVSDDFVVNTTAEGPQFFPRVSPLQSGGFVAIWESRDTTDGSGTCVRARIFGADGTPAASDFIVNSTTLDNQMTPSVTVLEDGHFVATYYSSEAGDGSVGCIRARLFDAAGTALGPDFIVNSTAGGDQEEPQVSALAGGGFVETWTSYESPPGSAAEIRARMFDADGNPVGLDFQVNSTATGREIEPEITALSSGGFVATWTTYPRADGTGGDGSSGCIRARVFDVAGSPLSDDFIVNAVTMEDQYAPRIAEAADGTIVITWYSYDVGDGSGTCIRAISFNPDGTGLTVDGTADADTITGSPFADVINGDAGGDTIWAGSGSDQINGSAGADTMYGGEGDDTFEVDNVSDNPVEYAGAGTDTVIASFSYTLGGNIENLRLAAGAGALHGTGSTVANVLTGNESDNRLAGLGGDDTLIGGAGSNILNGGTGYDTADYSAAPTGVIVNLPLGAVENGHGGTDDVTDIEAFIGSAWNDSFIGGAGNHAFHGGNGSDTLDYSSGPDGVSVSVNAGSAVNAYGGIDTFSSIENVIGSSLDDSLSGNGQANALSGNDGDDALKGGAGADALQGGDGDDVLAGGSGNDVLDGGTGSDSMSGGSGDDLFIASTGDDAMAGGSGIDTADFSALAVGGVTVKLLFERVQLANGDRLAISQIENLIGTAQDDKLSGDDRANVISGGGGADTVSGGDGNDTLHSHAEEGAYQTVMDGGGGTDSAAISRFTTVVDLTIDIGDGGGGRDIGEGTTLAGIEQLSLQSGTGNDTVVGAALGDAVWTNGGDDTVTGAGGDDEINVGDGNDTAVFSGAWKDYAIAFPADYQPYAENVYEVADRLGAARDGTDNVWNVENFQFSNGTFFAADILNDTPTDIMLSATAVDENAANGTAVASISSTDADAPMGDTATYTLLEDAGGRFAISGGNLVVANSGLLDYEAAASHDVTIRVTDVHGAVYDETFTITLNDLPGVTITGTSGADLVDATHTVAGQPLPTPEGDIINGRAGNDTIFGLGGDDTISGGNGADFLSGGDGVDTLNAEGTSLNQTINLATNAITGGDSTGDVISGFENVIAGSGSDTLTGTSGANTLNGGAGNDLLTGGAGADVLIGGSGVDTIDYIASLSGVTVNLLTGSLSGGDAAGDTVSGIEAVRGSGADDVITGDNGANTLSGQGGIDTISGGGGDDTISGGNGADILSGGNGNDTLNAGGTSGNQTINLETNFVTGGDSTGDVISGFENAIGGLGNDVLTGSSVANILNGGAGADTLAGGAGADQLTGGTGNDIFRFVAVSDGGDTITDFSGGGVAGGDKIDLSAIDATPGGADNAFIFGGTSATAHGVWYAVSGGNATLYADTDGNAATAEFSIILKSVTSLTQGDDFIV